MRSTAGPLFDGLGGKSDVWESSNARMAIRASVDSDTCRWAATAANKRLSCGVGRAVIDGAVAFAAPSFTARQPVLLHIADTSLSCHHSNNDPTTLPDLKSLPISNPPIRTYTLAKLLSVCALSFAVFFSETRLWSARRSERCRLATWRSRRDALGSLRPNSMRDPLRVLPFQSEG